MSLKLNVITASTRPGRVGPAVAQWFSEFARQQGNFEVELVDLDAFDLPMLDEPNHPRMQQYENDHTKRWSASVDGADAFVFVTPEYNHFPTPALVNAIDYLFHEWNYKPCGFVSYGGVSGGLRALQASKQQVTTVKMMPLPESVAIPMVAKQLRDGEFSSNELIDDSATTMLGELLRWAQALKPMRA